MSTTPTTPATGSMSDRMLSTANKTEGNSFPDLAERIKAEHAAVTEATKHAVRRAIAAGELLNAAKNKVERGQWLTWLEKNCHLSERTAQRYMKLADGKLKLEEALTKSATVADLTLNKAEQLVDGRPGSKRGGGGENPSDAYDSAERKLIKKLEALSPDAADAAASDTIKTLRETVATMKSIVAAAAKKAA